MQNEMRGNVRRRMSSVSLISFPPSSFPHSLSFFKTVGKELNSLKTFLKLVFIWDQEIFPPLSMFIKGTLSSVYTSGIKYVLNSFPSLLKKLVSLTFNLSLCCRCLVQDPVRCDYRCISAHFRPELLIQRRQYIFNTVLKQCCVSRHIVATNCWWVEL